MKILMTGFTPRGTGSTRLLYSYMSNTSVIVKVLKEAGHEIDQRVVDVDEPGLTDKYDMALVGIAVPQSLSSRYLFGALWAAESFGPARTRFYVDDWLLHQFASQLESALREPEKRFYSLDNRHCYEAAKKHSDIWTKWYKFFLKTKFPLLIPAFPWSKPRVLLPRLDNVQPVIFDPTPLALTDSEVMYGGQGPTTFNVEDPEDRERTWTLAAMRDVKPWFDKQRFDWPVVQYGNKRQGQPIVTEQELLGQYCKRWGIIGAPYPVVTAGGGWRARYIHAAVTNSILFLDPDEGRTAGKPYDLYRSVVEAASDQELVDIAGAQQRHLLEKTWTRAQLLENLDAYVRGAIQ